MLRRTIKKLQFKAERIRTLTPEQLRVPAGGMAAVSNPTDEMGQCSNCHTANCVPSWDVACGPPPIKP